MFPCDDIHIFCFPIVFLINISLNYYFRIKHKQNPIFAHSRRFYCPLYKLYVLVRLNSTVCSVLNYDEIAILLTLNLIYSSYYVMNYHPTGLQVSFKANGSWHTAHMIYVTCGTKACTYFNIFFQLVC